MAILAMRYTMPSNVLASWTGFNRKSRNRVMSPGINKEGSPVAWRRPSPAFTLPGGACRTTGLSRSSFPGTCQSITRGPMEVLCRHHSSSVFPVFIQCLCIINYLVTSPRVPPGVLVEKFPFPVDNFPFHYYQFGKYCRVSCKW